LNVTTLRETLQRLESEGRGDCDLYVTPTLRLSDASHRPGGGVVIGFDKVDHPVEAVDDGFCQPEDSAIIFLEFGLPAAHAG
jgi:hypothetical protein